MEEQTIDNTLSGVCAAESLKFYALFMSMRMKGNLGILIYLPTRCCLYLQLAIILRTESTTHIKLPG